MAPGFRFNETQIYVPLALAPKERDDRNMHGYSVMVKLKHGVSLKQAQAEMDSFAATFSSQYPDADQGIKFALNSLQEDTVGNSRLALLVLMGAVVLVLLIGCANVGSLALARSLARQKEVAVRAALGASRGRIVRQFLVESLLLALIGGAVGWMLGMYGVDAFRHLAPADTPRLEDLRMDRLVFVFTLGVSVLASVLFGLAPALQSSRTNVGGSAEGIRAIRFDGNAQQAADAQRAGGAGSESRTGPAGELGAADQKLLALDSRRAGIPHRSSSDGTHIAAGNEICDAGIESRFPG